MKNGATVIFDLDGTLHRTESALVPAIRMAMVDLGFPPASPETINALYGEPLEVFSRVLLGDTEKLHRHFRQRIRKHQRETLPGMGELYPGTVEMLDELIRMGLFLAVCSNAGLDYVELVTGSLGITGKFSMMVGRDGQASKADRIARIIRESGAESAVMVGDRYHDIEAAAACGIQSIGCLYGYGRDGELDGADIRVVSTLEILPAVTELMGRQVSDGRITPVP